MSHTYASPASDVLNADRGLIQKHRPAFWAFVVLFIAGAVTSIVSILSASGLFTVAGGLGTVGSIAFGAAAFWLITQLSDLDPKPMGVAIGTLLAGAVIVPAVVQFESGSLSHLIGTVVSDAAVVQAFTAATGEELYKALTVILVFLIVPWWWRRPLDGLVFGALVGLGFQIFEDIVYITGGAVENTGATAPLEIFLDRIVLAGFFSHAAWTALFGLGFAYAVTAASASMAKRVGAAVGGFALAWVAHLVWDLPFLASIAARGTFGLIGYVALKSLPFLAILALLVVRAVKDERSFFHRHARGEIDLGTLDDDDVARLETFGGRITARREPGDHQTKFHRRHLIRAQLDLVRLHMHGFDEPELLDAQRSFIRELKDQAPVNSNASGDQS